MINNYKIDYIGQTADNYMTFPQTEQSQKILQRNQTSLITTANNLGRNIAEKARFQAEKNGPSGRVDVIV